MYDRARDYFKKEKEAPKTSVTIKSTFNVQR